MTVRKSDQQKKLEGTYRKDRALKSPAGALPLGKIPKHLTDEQKEAWTELVGMIPEGVLFRSDRLILEVTADLMAKQRSGELNNGSLKLYLSCLQKLGLSPMDRSKVPSIPTKPPEKNVFDKFFN